MIVLYNFITEGPLAHDQPTYAGLPGINVHGMLCVPNTFQDSSSSQLNNRWNLNRRPPISSEYRAKNTTIEAISEETTVAVTTIP
jgi:hypothetical protein